MNLESKHCCQNKCFELGPFLVVGLESMGCLSCISMKFYVVGLGLIHIELFMFGHGYPLLDSNRNLGRICDALS